VTRHSLSWLMLVLALAASPGAAQESRGIARYRETIDLAGDGSAAVAIDVTLAGWLQDYVDLPLNVAKPDALAVEAAERSPTATVVRNGDVRLIRVGFDRRPAPMQALRVTFTAAGFLDWDRARSPRGVYALAYTFANTTPTTVGDYALRVLLPAGYVVAGVTGSTPRATGEEIDPPYGFATRDGRTALDLRAKSVAPGRFAAISFGFEPEQRSPLAVVAICLLVGLVGLYLKRDALTRASFERKTAG
jgi:hypothetical protein